MDSVQLPFLANVNCILERGNSSNFLVGTDRGVYLLPEYYPLSLWIPINTGLPSVETKVRAIIEKDGEIFAGTNGGVYQLNGFIWDEKNIGLTNTNVTALSSTNGYLIAGTSQGSIGGVYISADNGGNCALSYSVFGLFAFCPDCSSHNSLQILIKNLGLISGNKLFKIFYSQEIFKRSKSCCVFSNIKNNTQTGCLG